NAVTPRVEVRAAGRLFERDPRCDQGDGVRPILTHERPDVRGVDLRIGGDERCLAVTGGDTRQRSQREQAGYHRERRRRRERTRTDALVRQRDSSFVGEWFHGTAALRRPDPPALRGGSPPLAGAVNGCFAEPRGADHLEATMRQVAGARSRRRAARRNPRNITQIPASKEIENGPGYPSAANAEPNPAMIVAPNAISNVPQNRSRSSGRPRMRQADHRVPPSRTRYAGIATTGGSRWAEVPSPNTSLPEGRSCARASAWISAVRTTAIV